ncbi:2-phospho-L-lactate guanylyltransferase [Actinacidiphila yeochonensis]|uniref:2-phospho-L-lactate guanylyltransferase n=1 Tax=Actinacidiphila yeochonensis TaxID=89050 RepID=UPI001E4FD747|nr:2-phospho-L-lactate guanylyltransferase [Actinacidiphila yeochonensis]
MDEPFNEPVDEAVNEPRWSLVVPLKPLALAKSRLAAAGPLRPALALAFALDTVGAALACPEVAEVTVVTDDPAAAAELVAVGAHVVPDSPAAGLNAALRHGAAAVRARRASAPVAALNGDLPALRPAELAQVLRAAAGIGERAFVTDAAGIGTTLLAAPPAVVLAPAFGGPSRARHLASGAAEIGLPHAPSVRQDVDTLDDLRAALALGVGPATAEAAAALLSA